MSTSEPDLLDPIRRAWWALERHDVAGVLAQMTSDVEFRPALAAAVEGAPVLHGRQEVGDYLGTLLDTYEVWSGDIAQSFAHHETLLVKVSLEVRTRASALGMSQQWGQVCTVHDGLVARMFNTVEIEDAVAEFARIVCGEREN
jgi:ketosteroid isomerase-like protein